MRFLPSLVIISCVLQGAWIAAHPTDPPKLTRSTPNLPTVDRPDVSLTSSSPAVLTTPQAWSLACPATDALSCAAPQVDTCCTHAKGLIVLAQQWLTTVGERTKWGVHGLWPDFCDGTFPLSSCDVSRNTDNVSQYMTPELINRLNTFWISFKGDNNAFWSYEWSKHGTCMSTLEPRCHNPATYQKGQEIQPYFEKVVDLYEKHDIYKALEEAGITPQTHASGKTFPRDDVINAIKKKFGVIPQLNCTKDGSGDLDHLNLMFKVQGRDNYVLVDNFLAGNCPEKVKYPMKFDGTRPPPPPPKPKPSPPPPAPTPSPKPKNNGSGGGVFSGLFGWFGGKSGEQPKTEQPTTTPPTSPTNKEGAGMWSTVKNWWSGRSAVEKEKSKP